MEKFDAILGFLMSLSWTIYGTVDGFVNSSFYVWVACVLIGMGFCNARNDFKEEKWWKNGYGKELVSYVFVTNIAAYLAMIPWRNLFFISQNKTLYIERYL